MAAKGAGVGRSVLITGCSSGIGAAAARGLRARGWTVIAAARNPEDVARLQ
ncbi:SDR family NAD(P)-dependent oxidoreductase, partial [Roseicyclus amphidinii]|uniref:SDR family NAD(P)-dependent oxidoreductase n=1 Tax=Roseicyclus amphidinii TaxID=3034232 RepID=UPI0024E09F86